MRRARLSRSLALAAVLTGFVVLLASLGAVRPTLALFSDTSTVTTGALSSGSVTKPMAVGGDGGTGCATTYSLFGPRSLTTTWAASSTPTNLTYTAVVRGSGQELAITSSGTQRSVTVTSGLLNNLLGSLLFGVSFQIDVTATLPGTSWTATSTRNASYSALGGFTCGSWT